MKKFFKKPENIEKILTFIKVNSKNESHNKFLYDCLAKRKFNISHKNTPNFEEHCIFVREHPYRKWFLISYKSSLIGSIYVLYDNGIGLDLEPFNYYLIKDILKELSSEIKPLKAIPSIRRNEFHMNISNLNEKLFRILTELGGEHIQNTLIFEKF